MNTGEKRVWYEVKAEVTAPAGATGLWPALFAGRSANGMLDLDLAVDDFMLHGIKVRPVKVDDVFLTPKSLNVTRQAEHSFKVHVYPSEEMDVSVGDQAEVTVNGVKYDAIVSSTDVDGAALDIAIKVYMGEDLVDNDPTVAIYSINGISIVDADGNDIEYLQLDTFTPRGKK